MTDLPSGGHVVAPPKAERGPLCRGMCQGAERAAWDSPASFGKTPDGRKLIYCRCCERELQRIGTGLADAPNVAPGIDQTGRKRFECPNCIYEVVTLPDLKARA